MQTLHDYLYTAINDGARWAEASDIPEAMRGEIVNAWRADASPVCVSEAYLAGADRDADLATLLAFSLDEVLTHQAQQAMLNCFWAGMSWRVDKAITKAREDVRAQKREPLERIPYNWQEKVA